MGKGGLAVAGWVAIGIGGLLIYAGMTGQSLVGELQGILAGRSPAQLAAGKRAPAPATPATDGQPGTAAGNGAAGSGAAGGGGGSW